MSDQPHPVGAGGETFKRADEALRAMLGRKGPTASITCRRGRQEIIHELWPILSASPVEGGKGFMASRDHAPSIGFALDWRPIDSAPHDETSVLLFRDAHYPEDRVIVGYWVDDGDYGEGWYVTDGKNAYALRGPDPTRWAPLSEPSSSAEQVEGEGSRDDPKSPLTNGVREETKAGVAFRDQRDRLVTLIEGYITEWACDDPWLAAQEILEQLPLASPPLGAAVEALRPFAEAAKDCAGHEVWLVMVRRGKRLRDYLEVTDDLKAALQALANLEPR